MPAQDGESGVSITIGVTGATGGVGRRVTYELSLRQEITTVAIARNRTRLADVRPQAAQQRLADYDDQDALASALTGLDSLVFVSSDGEPSVMWRHHRNVVDAIRR